MVAQTPIFLDHRSRRLLQKFRQQVDDIMNAIEESKSPISEIDDSVESLRREIDTELARIGSSDGINSETASFKPALNEASMYLEKYFAASSAEEAFDAMYDVGFSIGYYVSELSEQ